MQGLGAGVVLLTYNFLRCHVSMCVGHGPMSAIQRSFEIRYESMSMG